MSVLKEFDLDLPYVEDKENIQKIMMNNNMDYDTACKYDYDNNWKSKRNTFRLETRCITSFVERVFEKFITKDCWKILVECVYSIEKPHCRNLIGVYAIEIPFDIEKYFLSNDITKKKITLELLAEGVKRVVQEMGWDIEPFNKAFEWVINDGYINEWTWKKPLKSPLKKYTAEILCQHELYAFNIYVLIKTKDRKVIRQEKLLSEKPDEFFFYEYFGQLKWISHNEVALISKNGENSWGVNLDLVD